jgi:hypothetical protein
LTAKGTKLEPISVANALATVVGYASTIQVNLGVMDVAELSASYARIHGATKIRILFFSQSTVGYSREEENRQSEKLHLTLDVLKKKGPTAHGFSNFSVFSSSRPNR